MNNLTKVEIARWTMKFHGYGNAWNNSPIRKSVFWIRFPWTYVKAKKTLNSLKYEAMMIHDLTEKQADRRLESIIKLELYGRDDQ